MALHRMNSDDVAGLAAAHAALDPDRRKWRSDILISGIIETLASHGPLTVRQLHTRLKNLWLTNAVGRAMIRTTLEWAEKENLVEQRRRTHDDCWAATSSSIEEAKLDKETATAAMLAFEQAVSQKLDTLSEGRETFSEEQARDLAHILMGAFMAGSERVFEGVLRSANPSRVDSIDFDIEAVYARLREQVERPSLQKNLIALARAAFDPTDEFGTDILHLIVAGKILQGMMARRDLPVATPLPGSVLLLDTSALMYRIYPGGPQPQLLEDLLQASQEAGCSVIVTRAVLREWASVWRAAEKEAQTVENSATGIPSQSWRYEKNAPIRFWLWKRDTGQPQKWVDFQRRNSNIEPWLTERQVEIIEDGKANPELAEQLRVELLRLVDAAQTKMRTATTARTDAYSAALVTEARDHKSSEPIPRSWFIAQDRLTNRAYKNVRPHDSFPLTATVETWLLLLSVTRTYDPTEERNLAEVMGDAVIRNSFLAVSANYTIDDIVDLVEVLKKESIAGEDDLADHFRSEFFAQADGEPGDFAAALARHRAMRRNRHVTIRQEQVKKKENDLLTAVHDAERREKEEKARFAQLEVRATRWRHGTYLAIGLALTGLGIVLSAFLGASALAVLIASVAWLACGVEGIRWLRKTPEASAWVFVLGLTATIAWTVLSSLLGAAVPHPATTHPVPARTSSPASISSGRAGSSS